MNLDKINSVANTAPASTTAATATASQSTALENFSMSQIIADEFSSSIAKTNASINDIDSLINETEDESIKQDLIAKKETLIAEKKELEAKQKTLKSKMNQLKSEADAYKQEVAKMQSELKNLAADKTTLESSINNENQQITSKNTSLDAVNANIENINSELQDAMEDLDDSVSEMKKQSEAELSKQRKAISAATTEALALVQSGELDSEDMPAYIAGKINGMESFGNVAGNSVLDAKNTKVKGLCSALVSLTNQKGVLELSIKASTAKLSSISPLIESLSSQMNAKSSQLKSKESALNAKNTELNTVTFEYNQNDARLLTIENDVASIDAQLKQYDTADQTRVTSSASQNIANTIGSFVASKTSSIFNFQAAQTTDSSQSINVHEELDKINEQFEKAMSQEVKNTKAQELKGKMEEADKLIVTLRNHLADNAQKLIDERLSATKRK